jgi:hypothetical protein
MAHGTAPAERQVSRERPYAATWATAGTGRGVSGTAGTPVGAERRVCVARYSPLCTSSLGPANVVQGFAFVCLAGRPANRRRWPLWAAHETSRVLAVAGHADRFQAFPFFEPQGILTGGISGPGMSLGRLPRQPNRTTRRPCLPSKVSNRRARRNFDRGTGQTTNNLGCYLVNWGINFLTGQHQRRA